VLRIAPLTAITPESKLFVEDIARIGTNVALGGVYNVTVQAGPISKTFGFQITMAGMVAKIAMHGHQGAQEAANYLLAALQDEWNREGGTVGTIYDNGNTRLDEVLNAYKTLSQEQKQVFTQEMYKSIRSIYPAARGGFWDKTSDDYDEIEKLFAAIGWRM
jgi:hypothetical protein